MAGSLTNDQTVGVKGLTLQVLKPVRSYYQLTKPGIIYGNAVTAIAGFLFAAKDHVNFSLMLSMLVGISLVIAAACVCNNYIDRGIDAKMDRTKDRALVAGTIAARSAMIYAAVLGIAGFSLLAFGTNYITLSLAAIGIVFYVVIYGIAKRRSVHGTLVGSISGGVPILVGYTAAKGHVDIGALILFAMMCLWQMPHFYAIATYRSKEYKAAGIPVLPVAKGVRVTKIQVVSYVALFTVVSSLLTVFGYAGFIYLATMAVLGLVWLRLGIKGFKEQDNNHWAKQMFGFSLIVVLGMSVILSISPLLP